MKDYKESKRDDWSYFEQCYRKESIQYYLFYNVDGKDYFFTQSKMLKNLKILLYLNMDGQIRAFSKGLKEVIIF
ncbi:hypothetical protein HYW75_01675 [Candidatus Pacearchaeota archaeon]|nr:hypothetical protein [Candidatus Pacearchaeota archaeon]